MIKDLTPEERDRLLGQLLEMYWLVEGKNRSYRPDTGYENELVMEVYPENWVTASGLELVPDTGRAKPLLAKALRVPA